MSCLAFRERKLRIVECISCKVPIMVHKIIRIGRERFPKIVTNISTETRKVTREEQDDDVECQRLVLKERRKRCILFSEELITI